MKGGAFTGGEAFTGGGAFTGGLSRSNTNLYFLKKLLFHFRKEGKDMQCSLRDNGNNWAQHLSIMPISDQFEDESWRSEGFYFICVFVKGSGCYKRDSIL